MQRAQGFRLWPLLVVLAVVTFGFLSVAVLVLPGHLVQSRGLTAAERLKAENDVRGSLLQAFLGLGAVATLFFTGLTYYLTRRGQVTDRFKEAIEQLAKKDFSIRLGAIYALERIAWDSPRDRRPIVELVTAYVREHARWKENKDWESGADAADSFDRMYEELDRLHDAASDRERWEEQAQRVRHEQEKGFQKTETVFERRTLVSDEVVAAVGVLGRRHSRREGFTTPRLRLNDCDLRLADLQYADLRDADLTNAHFERADLRGARFSGAELKGAHLEWANLQDASLASAVLVDTHLQFAGLVGARLYHALLNGADLRYALLNNADLYHATGWRIDLRRADLRGAKLKHARLPHAKLGRADLRKAMLSRAILTDANMRGARLDGAVLHGTDLSGADLTDAVGLTPNQRRGGGVRKNRSAVARSSYV